MLPGGVYDYLSFVYGLVSQPVLFSYIAVYIVRFGRWKSIEHGMFSQLRIRTTLDVSNHGLKKFWSTSPCDK